MRRSHRVDPEMGFIMDDIQKQDHSQSPKTGNLGNSGNLPPLVWKPNLIKASDVEVKQLKWLWPGVIPEGKLCQLAGEPGTGKSLITLFIASTLSRGGHWPVTNEKCQIGKTLIISCEDTKEDVINPRLIASGAKLDNICYLHTLKNEQGHEKSLDLKADYAALEVVLNDDPTIRLIIIDPIVEYLCVLDTHKNSDVRQALSPLANLADKYSVSILFINHLNKNQNGSAISRVNGSGAFTAVVRSSYLVSKDPLDKDLRYMHPMKNNLASDDKGFSYRISKVMEDHEQSIKIDWSDEYSAKNADWLVQQQYSKANRHEDKDQLALSLLKDGPVESSKIYEAFNQREFSKDQTYDTLNRIGAIPDKKGGVSKWKLLEGN